MVDRIREIISARNFTPTQFADEIGVARPIISHILSGRNKPSLEVVQKIVAALPDISLPWLLSGMGTMQEPTVAITPATTRTASSSERKKDAKASETARPAPNRNPAAPSAPAPPKVPSGTASDLNMFPAAHSMQTLALSPDLPLFAAPAAGSIVTSSETGISEPLEPGARPAALGSESKLAAETTAPPVTSSAPAALPLSAGANTTAVAPTAAQVFAEPGKSIRRIVIFYQDGTFTDYQPEAK